MMVKAANQLVKSSITFTEFFWSLSVVILYQSILNLYVDCFPLFLYCLSAYLSLRFPRFSFQCVYLSGYPLILLPLLQVVA